MIHEVHIFRSDLIEIERLLMRKRRRFHPIAIFPPPGDSCYLTDVDLRIEIGREMLAMIAAIAIQYVERVDPVQIVLFKIGREHAGNAGIEAGTQQRHQAGVLEAIMICPLPMIFELRLIARFVRSEEHTSELQSLMRISYAVFCLKKKKNIN